MTQVEARVLGLATPQATLVLLLGGKLWHGLALYTRDWRNPDLQAAANLPEEAEPLRPDKPAPGGDKPAAADGAARAADGGGGGADGSGGGADGGGGGADGGGGGAK